MGPYGACTSMCGDGCSGDVWAVGTAAPQAKNLQISTLFIREKKRKSFLQVKFREFSTISSGKHPFWLVGNKINKSDGNSGNPARGQADPGSAAVY